MSNEENPSTSPLSFMTWFLGIGNFILVGLFGSYFSFKTHELESKITTVQTAGQFIEIVADEQAPGYAKSLALNSIFDERLLSRDLILEAAYRIEDDTLERTVVGPLLYQIAADTDELLALPFGYFDYLKARAAPDGTAEITLSGWALDDQGWSSDRMAEGQAGLPLLQIHLGGAVRCEYPYREGLDCAVDLNARRDIELIFQQYPDARMSGFNVRFTESAGLDGPKLLALRLIDRSGKDRVLYSRCIDLGQSTNGDLAIETPYRADGCGSR